MKTRAAGARRGDDPGRTAGDDRGDVPPGPSTHPGTTQGESRADDEPPSQREVRGTSKKRGPSEIVIYRDWCKACGICIEFCPTRVFDIGDAGEPLISHPAKCISCDLCELLCPDFAITLHRPDNDKGEV